MSITRDMAESIWEVLVIHCGASAAPRHQEAFAAIATEPEFSEYRFGGNLGFGGKFFATDTKWWVSCAKENDTAETMRMVNAANKELVLLKASMEPLGIIARCLHKRYAKKYKVRAVEIEPEERKEGSRLCIVWRYANSPYRIYFRLIFRDGIIAQKLVKEERTHVNWKERWEDMGKVPYEDPKMEKKLDRLIERCIGGTLNLECESGGMVDTAGSNPAAPKA